MHTIVIYRSKSGNTRKYAEWIAEELGADLLEASRCGIERISQYDTVVYGGGLYATGINGVKLITNNLRRLKGKKIAVFATGGFDYKKLDASDRFLMNVLRRRLKRKAELTADERGMLAAYDHPVDFVQRKNIVPIIEYVRN